MIFPIVTLDNDPNLVSDGNDGDSRSFRFEFDFGKSNLIDLITLLKRDLSIENPVFSKTNSEIGDKRKALWPLNVTSFGVLIMRLLSFLQS